MKKKVLIIALISFTLSACNVKSTTDEIGVEQRNVPIVVYKEPT